MKKHINLWLVMFLAISLALPIYSMAQTPTITLESYSTGDRISGAPIKSFFWGTDGNLVVYLAGPFTFSSLLPDITIDDTQGTYTNCVPTKPATVTATQPAPGTSRPISFKVISATSGATLSLVVDPEGRTLPASSSSPFTFPSWEIGGSTPAAVGAYLAVFEGTSEGTSGTNKSQLVVMININPPETVSTPAVSGPSTTGTVNQSYTFTVTTSSTVTPSGDPVQYFFDWGDGNNSGWLGTTSASHSWATANTYSVKVQARCATHTSVVSAWSAATSITISNAPVQTYTVTLSANPNAGGTVSGASSYAAGTSVTVTATAASSYTFTSWTEGTSATPLSGTSPAYTFTMPANPRTLTANFSGGGGGGGGGGGCPNGQLLPLNAQNTLSFGAGSQTCYICRFEGSTITSASLLVFGKDSGTNLNFTWTFPDGTSFSGGALGTDIGGNIKVRSNKGYYPNYNHDYIPAGDHILTINSIGYSTVILTMTYN